MTTYGFSTSQINEAQWATMNVPVAPEHVESGFAATVGTGTREVDLSAGTALVAGTWTSLGAGTVACDANASGNPRIDTVVLEIDWGTRAGALAVVKGTAAASPVAPTLTRSENTTWQCPLADVYVANGATTFSAGNITDRRPHTVPVYSQASTMTRPPATDKALLIESDTNGMFHANGSAWNRLGSGYCSASLSATVTPAEQTATLLNAWTEDENSGEFTVGASGVTVDADGVYLVQFDIEAYHETTADSWYYAQLGVNATGTSFATDLVQARIGWSPWTSSGAQGHSAHGSIITTLTDGDEIGLVFYGDKSGDTSTWTINDGDYTHLNIVRLA